MSVKALLKASVLMVLSAGLFVPAFSFAQTTGQSNPNAGVQAQVDSYFADIPVMIAIANCESGFRQFNANGGVLIGGNGYMVGVFQLDETVHTAPATALGFNIDTVTGNLGYARYLYGAEGTDPWISSFGCWGTGSTSTGTASVTSVTTTSTAALPVLTENLSLGDVDPQVLILQQLLNKVGFTLATSGPGSPGNETTKFGALTRAAVRAFQCAQGITCSGSEATTGYGFVNAATRSALLALVAAQNVPVVAVISSSTPSSTISSSSTTLPPTPTSTAATVSTSDQLAEAAQLQSQITALLTIISQLEAQIAAKADR